MPIEYGDQDYQRLIDSVNAKRQNLKIQTDQLSQKMGKLYMVDDFEDITPSLTNEDQKSDKPQQDANPLLCNKKNSLVFHKRDISPDLKRPVISYHSHHKSVPNFKLMNNLAK